MYNRCVKNWLKIPNRLEKIVRKLQGGIFLTHTIYADTVLATASSRTPWPVTDIPFRADCSHSWCMEHRTAGAEIISQQLQYNVKMCIYCSLIGTLVASVPFGYCPSTAFLPVWPQCANARRNRCQDLSSIPLAELEATTWTPSYYVDEDYIAGPEIQ